MRTIAIMTMAFLPGTFFATLFSVPSLRWGENTIIGPNFWVYWAFTLPATILVFGIWVAITKSEWVRTNLARPWRKKQSQGGSSGSSEGATSGADNALKTNEPYLPLHLLGSTARSRVFSPLTHGDVGVYERNIVGPATEVLVGDQYLSPNKRLPLDLDGDNSTI